MSTIRLLGAAVIAVFALTAATATGASANRLVLTEEMMPLLPGASAELEVESAEIPCATNSKGTVVTNQEAKDELSFGKAEEECSKGYEIGAVEETIVEPRSNGRITVKFSPKLTITHIIGVPGTPCVYEYSRFVGVLSGYPTGVLSLSNIAAIGRLNRRASVVGCVPTVSQQFMVHIFSQLGFMEYQVRG
jgi:hypothetical protein